VIDRACVTSRGADGDDAAPSTGSASFGFVTLPDWGRMSVAIDHGVLPVRVCVPGRVSDLACFDLYRWISVGRWFWVWEMREWEQRCQRDNETGGKNERNPEKNR
jgi:hypothetical protein